MSILVNKKRKGFTLIEMLVSMALFSIVVVVVMGAIMTIVDSNRKARSLMTVMNNLNFTVDAVTRSFKTAQDATGVAGGSNEFSINEIDYEYTESSVNVTLDNAYYRLEEINGIGAITKDGVPLTSPDINIDLDNSEFKLLNQNSPQPLLIIKIVGEVVVTPTISSKFNLQTSVSQRKLEI